MVLCDFKRFNIGNASYHIRVTSSKFNFSFRVSESTWYWQTTWKDSNWPYYIIWVTFLLILLVSRSCGASSCCCLIYLPTSSNDTLIFKVFTWFMISRQRNDLLPSVAGQDCPAVSHICDEAHLPHYQCNYGAGPASLLQGGLTSLLIYAHAHLHKSIFRLLETLQNCFLRIPWEWIFFNYEMVEIVPKILSTGMTPMTIINTKKWTLRPFLMLSMLWFHYV